MSCRLIQDPRSATAQVLAWNEPGQLAGNPAETGPAQLYSDPRRSAEPNPDVPLRNSEHDAAAAYQRGLRDGEAAAAHATAGQVTGKIEQLSRSIEQLAARRGQIHREAESEMVRLSLAIARRILRRELSVDPDSLLGLVKAGLEKIESSEAHRVRVHPEHAPVLARLLEGAARQVEIVADAALPVGAVIFETSRGSVDAGLETQLKEIERGFTDLYPR
jgi:flagellar assembly protein FliH